MDYLGWMRRHGINRGEKKRIAEQIPVVAEKIKDIHIEMGQFRADGLPNEMISLGQKFHTQIYASNITLVKDLENVMAMGVHHCYGGLMMPPVSRHQMLHISDSRIAKAIFSLHPHKNPNGDK